MSPKADFQLCLYAKISLPTHAEMSKVFGSVRVYAKFSLEGNRILVFRPIRFFFQILQFQCFLPSEQLYERFHPYFLHSVHGEIDFQPMCEVLMSKYRI